MKTIKIKIFSDGRVQAQVNGVKGKACTDFIPLLEEILDAETVDSSRTSEYYETEKLNLEQAEKQMIKNR